MGVLKDSAKTDTATPVVAATPTNPDSLIGQQVEVMNTIGTLRHPDTGKLYEALVAEVVELDHFLVGQLRSGRVKIKALFSDESLSAPFQVKAAAPTVTPADTPVVAATPGSPVEPAVTK